MIRSSSWPSGRASGVGGAGGAVGRHRKLGFSGLVGSKFQGLAPLDLNQQPEGRVDVGEGTGSKVSSFWKGF